MSTNLKIFLMFLVWRISLFSIAAVSIYFFSKFGARFPYFEELLIRTGYPNWVWGFGNFDGVYYIKIAKEGYLDQYLQVFFPLFPLIIRFFNVFNDYLLSGLVLANLFFVAALYFLYKLFRLDFDNKITLRSICLLLSLPSAFYFGSLYSESFFLLLVLITFFFIRRNNYLLAGFFAALASATRVIGILLLFVLVIEFYQAYKNKQFKDKEDIYKGLIGIIISPFGLLLYMAYLRVYFNDPLFFLNAQPVFGAERSNQPFVLLPQVLFRYLKILSDFSIGFLPFINALFEFSMTIFPLGLLLYFYKKIRFSYFIFSLGALMIPTMTGTLSSMPRYALMGFLILPWVSQFLGKYFKISIIFLSLLQAFFLMLFIRGYWVS